MPGGGGTQRLPRLTGPSEALKMMLTGAHVPAKKAKIMDKLKEFFETLVLVSVFVISIVAIAPIN